MIGGGEMTKKRKYNSAKQGYRLEVNSETMLC